MCAMHKDYLGQSLSVGDTVVIIQPNGRNFDTSTIARFTKCYVILVDGYKHKPHQVIKRPEQISACP
jgi:hypothetical protein